MISKLALLELLALEEVGCRVGGGSWCEAEIPYLLGGVRGGWGGWRMWAVCGRVVKIAKNLGRFCKTTKLA